MSNFFLIYEIKNPGITPGFSRDELNTGLLKINLKIKRQSHET